MTAACPLCTEDGGTLLARTEQLRVVLVDDADYPGFCRVIWNAHVREMTDLTPDERNAFMRAVFAVESAQRAVFKPHKINLASLGNQVPHLHWHVIPRFEDDAHFPNPVWGQRQRDSSAHDLQQRRALIAQLRAMMDESTSGL